MDIEKALTIIDGQLGKSGISDLQELIIRQSWGGKSYQEIATITNYNPDYIKVVAYRLWQQLSENFQHKVNKKNLRAVMRRKASSQEPLKKILLEQVVTEPISSSKEQIFHPSLPLPGGPLSPDSSFYLKRSAAEKQIYQQIQKPGALVRIKAPQEMGKTSLLWRTLDHCQGLGYRTISLNIEKVDQAILNDVNKFLRWLCVNSDRQLGLEARLDEYWDEDLGSKMSWTLYFEEYLLEQIDTPVILAFDQVNQIFEHPQVAEDFLSLLRVCYEEAKRIPIWQKLRLIVVHSTEIYVPLQLEQSPFNVGLPIELEGFSGQEVQQLAQRYGLNWTQEEEVKRLMEKVGGHPALVHLTLYHLSDGKITLAELLKMAPTPRGIYANHLQRHWVTLQKEPELAQALLSVVSAAEPVQLDPIITYKLSSMGLIKLEGNRATISCQLYRQYFEREGINLDSTQLRSKSDS